MENIKFLYNKIRIWFLSVFTNRIKRVIVEDQSTGKDHKIVVDQKKEKLCQHKKIEQISNLVWRCIECKDVYFFITYKVSANYNEMIEHLSDIRNHFKNDL